MTRRMQKMVLGIGNWLGVRAVTGASGRRMFVVARSGEQQSIMVQFVGE